MHKICCFLQYFREFQMSSHKFKKYLIIVIALISLLNFYHSCLISMWRGYAGGSAGKETTCSVEDLGLIPGLGRSPGEGNGYPLQFSGLENSMDCIIVHGVTKIWTQPSNFHSLVMWKIYIILKIVDSGVFKLFYM